MKKISLVIAVLVAMLTLTGSAMADVYDVFVNTSGLSGGPFTLDFLLTNGNGAADTTITVSNLDFGGGGFIGAPTTSVSLSDSGGSDFFSQTFNPGSFLSFVFTSTSAGAGGGTPDLFQFLIEELITTAPDGIDLVDASFDSSSPSFSAYSATNYDANHGGNAVQGVTPVVTVPEPASLTLIGGGMLITALRRRMKAKK